jgi:hypothetical protein
LDKLKSQEEQAMSTDKFFVLIIQVFITAMQTELLYDEDIYRIFPSIFSNIVCKKTKHLLFTSMVSSEQQ